MCDNCGCYDGTRDNGTIECNNCGAIYSASEWAETYNDAAEELWD